MTNRFWIVIKVNTRTAGLMGTKLNIPFADIEVEAQTAFNEKNDTKKPQYRGLMHWWGSKTNASLEDLAQIGRLSPHLVTEKPDIQPFSAGYYSF